MNRFLSGIIVLVALLAAAACDRPEDEPASSQARRTLLIYAVASNNLSTYLEKDVQEMIEAAPDVAGLGKDVRVLLYSVASKTATEATLTELTREAGGSYSFKTIKTYDRDLFSTDPERMRQVFSDVRLMADAQTYGLVMWSHATGWFPDFTAHEVPPTQRSFGWDTYQNVTDKCDIIELADAIPDRMFDFIWFDCCYMMGIEAIYQLRAKCDYIAGYPTEDWSPGMNYDVTLPMMASATPDLKGAAKAFYDYYNDAGMAVTVSLISTAGLDRLAAAAADIYAAGQRPSSAFGLQDYGRSPYRGLYDFGQLTNAYLDGADISAGDSSRLAGAFSQALGEVLIYGGCSLKDFNGNNYAFDPDIYSGFSCHFPDTSAEDMEQYYRNLDWTMATNP